jgi:hypothetical protein
MATGHFTAARKLTARVEAVLTASGGSFETTPCDHLDLGFDGIDGDFHAGMTRNSGGREPWYPRGTEMRNERQLSLVCPVELAEIAKGMGIDQVPPQAMGANLLLSGVPELTLLPPRSLMFFVGGVTLKVDGLNEPCRQAGRAIARAAGMQDIELAALTFKDAAKRRRGLVTWVEKPGRISAGETVTIRVPEQWIWAG